MKTLHLSNYAIIQSGLNHQLKSQFAVHHSLLHELEEYRLVYWKASHLYRMVQNNRIECKDIKYQVTMINCDLVKLYELALNDPDRQIRISFRRARKHWDLSPYAIIKLPAPLKGLPVLTLESKRNYDHD